MHYYLKVNRKTAPKTMNITTNAAVKSKPTAVDNRISSFHVVTPSGERFGIFLYNIRTLISICL